MLRVLLFFTNLCLFVNSDEVPNKIEINIPKEGGDGIHFVDPTTKVALRDHPLDIVIKDYDATEVRCYDRSTQISFGISFNNQKIIDGKKSLVIQVEEVNDKMSTVWDCIVINHKRGLEEKHIIFKLHVKQARHNNIHVTINDIQVKFKQTDLSEPQYDGIENCWYENGETINLLCRDWDQNGLLQIRYEDAYGKEMFRSNSSLSEQPVFFNGVMLKHNDYDKIDCIYTFKNITYTYRIIFRSKDVTSDSSFEISVNGLSLVPINKSREIYQYNIFDKEDLELTCEKHDKETPGDVMFYGNAKIAKQIIEIAVKRWKRTIIIRTKDLHKSLLKCFIKNDLSASRKSADILFVRDKKEPYITGLSPKRIAYQYSANDSTWVTHYKYNVGEKLKLTCASKKDNLLMYDIDSNELKLKENKNISYELILDSNHDGKTIICESGKYREIHRAVIYLHGNNIIPDSRHKAEDLILIITCSVTGLLIIIMAVSLAFWWRTNYKNNAPKDSCENLVHKFESRIPTISGRWSTRGCTNGVMIENAFYNGGPPYAYPNRRENTNSAEYNYIEVNDEIMKQHNELLKEYMAENESITEGGLDSGYIQPYATSKHQANSRY